MRPARFLILRRWVTTLVAILFAVGMQGAVVGQMRCARAHAAVRTQQVTRAPSTADAPASPSVAASDDLPGTAPLDDADGSRPCAPALVALPAEPFVESPPVAWGAVRHAGRGPPPAGPGPARGRGIGALSRLDRPPRA